MQEFWLCFVPLFIAMDGIAILPIFISFTEGQDKKTVHKIIYQSALTATLVALVFILGGQYILRFLGITVADFMIAGGVLLFIISMNDLFSLVKKSRYYDKDTLGSVPLGVPLIVGPGVLTTCLLLLNQHAFIYTTAALIVNVMLVGILFWFSGPIIRFLGKSGTKAISKIASLLLSAIAVMIIRKGLQAILPLFN